MKLEFSLTPKQSEFDKTVSRTPIVLFGGARGGGKSFGLRAIMLKRRFEYPGSIGYIFRRTYPELVANHISPLFSQYPQLRDFYVHGEKTLRFPNGSQLVFAYLEHDRDLQKFQGREMHDLAIEEAGEWTFNHYDYLKTCNRSSQVGIPTRIILTGNPGGVGHQWLKRLFIERHYEQGEKPSDYAFIPARVEDNPALMAADPEYVNRLDSMKNEVLRRAYRYGDWDVSAGQFFTEFKRSIHVLPRTFEVQSHWPRFGGYDFGYSHPSSWHWGAADGDGNLYIYRELIQPNLRIDEQAERIHSFKDSKNIVFHAGRDCWGKRMVAKVGMPPTIAEEFSTHHIYLKPANVDRKQGAARIRELLAVRNVGDKTVGPKLFILESCPVTIDTILRLTHDPDDPEDVLKIDASQEDPLSGDDAYDSLRYLIMSRPYAAQAPKKPWKDRYDSERPSRPSWQTV